MAVYLDNNATAPIRPEAREAMLGALEIGGNPSAVHAAGRAARAVIEEARGKVAALIGGEAERLVFASGGAEANTLAILSAASNPGVERLIVGATEHASVVQAAEASGLPLDVWPVDGRGVADLDWLADRLKRSEGRPAVALMLANNETGVIQPVAEAAAMVHAAGGLIHIDVVPAAGKIAVDLAALGADSLTLSAHKLGGPQGSAALLYGEGFAVRRQIHGGKHERGLRAGTENLSGIAGFGAAADASARDLPHVADQAEWRDAAEDRLAAAGAFVAGAGTARLPNTLSVATPDFPSAMQLMMLDLEGVMVSAGSACASGKLNASGVYGAMGRADLAGGAMRASGGWATTEADWVRFADAWLAAHARHAARHPVKKVA